MPDVMPDISTAAAELSARIDALGRSAPGASSAFRMLLRSALSGATPILTPRARAHVGLAMAVGSGCECCMTSHVRMAVRGGVTREEMLDLLEYAVLMADRPAMAWAAGVLAQFDRLAPEPSARIAARPQACAITARPAVENYGCKTGLTNARRHRSGAAMLGV